jgi:ABC-type multidrug transport system fused ATPase/permease subunit
MHRNLLVPGHAAETHQDPARVVGLGTAAPCADTSVRFSEVRFRYAGRRCDALNGTDFEVPAGKMVALVGHSGAGKSTCANLLMRHWDVTGGRISIGGRDVRNLPLETLRSLVAMVPKNVRLEQGTIADTICLGRPGATLEDVERAAHAAQIQEAIKRLPQAYDSSCGELSAGLSPGERQRVAIARAILHNPPVLILDEDSSLLEDEIPFHAALAEVRQERTLLVIARRLSTIRAADWIVVLEQGRVVEEGEHDDLILWNDRYARLIASPDVIA